MNNSANDFDTTLKIIFEKILYNFSPKEIDIFKNEYKQNLYNFHFGLGLWVRNYILLNNHKLCEVFSNQGIEHWDDISDFILQKFHDYLNNNL